MVDEGGSTAVEVGDKKYTITRSDVVEAFSGTEPPFDGHYKQVFIDGKGKGVKDVFRNIPDIPEGLQFHTHTAEGAFERLGFRIEDVTEPPPTDSRAWHLGFNSRGWWQQFRQSGSISLGYTDVDQDFRQLNGETLDDIVAETDSSDNSRTPSNPAEQVRKFAFELKPGDIIWAKDGSRYKQDGEWAGKGRVLAVGVVTGEYQYKDAAEWYDDLPEELADSVNNHHRTVDWIIDFEATELGSFRPDANIQQWTIDQIDYREFREQALNEYNLSDAFAELEARSRDLSTGTGPGSRTVWIEKSSHSTEYKQTDEWGLGEVIWCPQTMSNRASSVHYENIKEIAQGDIILHLDQETGQFTSASIASDTYVETTCPEGSRWDRAGVEEMGFEPGERPAYKLELESHTEFSTPLSIDNVFTEDNEERLNRVRNEEPVVFNKNLKLNQGAYLTKAPPELVSLIDEVLLRDAGHGLPHLNMDVYQCPIKPGGTIEQNYRRTVQEGISRSLVEDICEIPVDKDNLRVWGNREDTPANPGDYLLFGERDGRTDGEYSLLARIADGKILDKETASAFTETVGWGDGNENIYSHVMFLDAIYEVELDQERFWDLLNFKGWPNDTYSRIDFDREGSRFFDEYQSVDTFIAEVMGEKLYPGESIGDYWQDIEEKRRKSEIFLSNPTRENFEDWLADFSWYVSRYRENTAENLFDELSPDTVAEELERAAETGEIDAILDLTGFGVSAASEALSVLAPAEFAILNKDAAQSLAALRFERPNPSTSSAVKYKEFLEDVTELVDQYPLREQVDEVPGWSTDLEVANYAFYLHGKDEIDLSDLVPADPRAELAALLKDEAYQADLYRQAAAHLVAGKNVVFYGPPGTGKTRAADLLTTALCTSPTLETANAEWSNYQVVGGYRPEGESWAADPGFLTEAAQRCVETLRSEPARPSWLIIDELNRANLDEAFGDVFTLLDIDYRTREPLSYANTDVYVPLSFRILATMNTYDQAQLFSLGYAFRRRFAFVRVPSLLEQEEGLTIRDETPGTPSIPSLDAKGRELVELVANASIEAMATGADDKGVTESDVATIFPEYAQEEILRDALSEIRSNSELQAGGVDAIETLVYFGQEITKSDVVDIGQALLIDAVKYLLAHQLIFPDETDRTTLDEACVAYIVPQFEHFMSELRRAETINQDSDAGLRFDDIIELATRLQLPQTATVLTEAKETKRLLS